MSKRLQTILGFCALAAVAIFAYSVFTPAYRYEMHADKLPNDHYFIFDTKTGCFYGRMGFPKNPKDGDFSNQWSAYNRCPADFKYQEQSENEDEK